MIYKTEEFEVRANERQLLAHGKPVALGARAFDLLLALIEHRDRVLGKEELMALVWPGLAVEENNLTVQMSALRKALGANSVVTVSGRGYRFGLEIQTHKVSPHTELTLPDKPSVAVLPFLDLSDNPSHSFFVDGITEDITTGLSRFRDLFVIARNSAFTYKGKTIDVRAVSRELGVRYVVEGSVRCVGQRVLVTASLIDALSGEHVWVEKYNRMLGDIFNVQQELTNAIVAAMAPQIDAAETKQYARVRPYDLTAHGLAQQAWSIVAGKMDYDRSWRDKAFQLATEALAIDATCTLALRTIAQLQWWHAYHLTTDSLSATLEQGIAAATRAITLEPGDHHARRWKGMLMVMAQQTDEGLAELRRAHEINPNCALTLVWLGIFEAMHGDITVSVPYVLEALRLSPLDPSVSIFMILLGFAQFAVGDYAAAAQAAEAAKREAPNTAVPYLVAAISWVGVGDIERAHRAFQTLQQLSPKLAEARLAGQWMSDNTSYRERAHTFLRIAAGLEEPAAVDALRQTQ